MCVTAGGVGLTRGGATPNLMLSACSSTSPPSLTRTSKSTKAFDMGKGGDKKGGDKDKGKGGKGKGNDKDDKKESGGKAKGAQSINVRHILVGRPVNKATGKFKS